MPTDNEISEMAELPRFKCPLVLKLAADMFRQQSDLYLRHAAILERISKDPANPESWMLQEETPEVVERRIRQDETTTLAIKSYESMLQVQKRVDGMERLMSRNGVNTKAILASRNKKQRSGRQGIIKRRKEDPTQAFFWFYKEHVLRIAEALQQPYTANVVRKEVQRIWKLQNALERKPYIEKAERVKQLQAGNIVAMEDSKPAAKMTKVTIVKNPPPAPKEKPEDEPDSDSSSSLSNSSSSNSSEGEGVLF